MTAYTTYTAAAWQWQPTYNYYNPNELYHHGIMGMRWGKRHGPPYPLAPSAHSSEEKRLKSQNEGELDSWKARETAKVDKKYGKKVDRIQRRIAKTKGGDKLERLKSKKAKLMFKQSIKKAKIENTTEKQYAVKKRIKKALKVVGGVSVAVLAFYALNRIVGRRVSANRAHDLAEDYHNLKYQTSQLHDILTSGKPSPEWERWAMKELDHGIGEEMRTAYRAYNKAEDMDAIYRNGTLLRKVLTQIKGF